MDSMDINLGYENPDLMSSEFFDSVLSLGEQNIDLKYDNSLLDGLYEESYVPNDSATEMSSPRSYCSESDKTSVHTEATSESGSSEFDETSLLKYFKPNEITENISDMELGLGNAEPEPEVIKPVTEFIPQPRKTTPTKIILQNPQNRKLVIKTLPTKTFQKSKAKQQIFHVQSLSANGKPVFLPLKGIKILNTKDAKEFDVANLTTTDTHIKHRNRPPLIYSSIGTVDDDCSGIASVDGQYPPLNLTSEEKHLLSKEGIELPTHYPLTKNEERELKRIRRKIRNKISAQDSRKRKKEYVDGLEERVKRGSEENKYLLQRIKQLQKQNNRLLNQLNKLQSLLFNSSTTKAAPTTCLLIVLLSALLISIPNINLSQDKEVSQPVNKEESTMRRALLSSQQTTEDDTLNMDEFLVFGKEDDVDFETKMNDIENKTILSGSSFAKTIANLGIKLEELMYTQDIGNESFYNKLLSSLESSVKDMNQKNAYKNDKGFLEPDIDETPYYEPPAKRHKSSLDQAVENLTNSIVGSNPIIIANSKEK